MDFKKVIYLPLYIVFKPLNWFRLRKIKKVKFKNILIVGFYQGIGDFIFLSPLFRSLKQKYPEANITVLIKKTINDEFLVSNPNIDKIIKLQVNGIKRIDLLKYAWNELRPLKYDLILQHNWVNGVTIPFFCFLIGAKYRIGFNKSFEGFANTANLESFIQPKWDGKGTYIERHLGVMKVLGQKYTDLRTEIFLSKSAIDFSRTFIKDNEITDSHVILGIHAGSDIASKGRRWAIENFIEVINELIKEYRNIVIFFIYGPDEEKETERVKDECNDNRIFFINDNMTITAALIKKCHIFLSNDSMPLHLAKVFNIPVIGIFGPTNPYTNYQNERNFSPIYLGLNCQPCWVFPPVVCKYNDFRCLNRIKPTMVMDYCKTAIKFALEAKV